MSALLPGAPPEPPVEPEASPKLPPTPPHKTPRTLVYTAATALICIGLGIVVAFEQLRTSSWLGSVFFFWSIILGCIWSLRTYNALRGASPEWSDPHHNFEAAFGWYSIALGYFITAMLVS